MKYEFVVTKKLVGVFEMEADTEQEAREKVRDYAHRIVLVNNVSPWRNESIEEMLLEGGSDGRS